MPRQLVVGNGNLLVALDGHNMLQDFYYPYVGMEDQISFKHMHRIGIFDHGHFSWMHEGDWQHEIGYITGTLVTQSKATSQAMKLSITFNDLVYQDENFLLRKLNIRNDADYDREVKIFLGNDFHIYGDKQQDTAFFEPETRSMVHYRKRRYFWISGMTKDQSGITSFTTGKSDYRGLEGTFRDAEDGHLHEHPIEQGSVDSTVEFKINLPANGEVDLYVWIAAGKKIEEVKSLHAFIVSEGPEKLIKNTVNYWRSWVNKEKRELNAIDADLLKDYKRSLLIIRTQIDNRGAIIAANDSDIMKFNKDTYTYMWPRDGAWVALGLDRAGYGEITKRFFRFCAEVITTEGYLLHKYNPDKSVGSSWHPWYKDGRLQIPIQEDETALTLYALHQHFHNYGDIEFMQEMYGKLIRPAGNFLTRFVDKKTNLPLPSYDLWEREHGIFAYTCATVIAGLEAAAHLSELLGHFTHHKRYEQAAEKIKEATLKYLWDEEEGRFLNRLIVDPNTGELIKDKRIDASMHALWMLGILPADDPRIVSTNEAIFNALHVKTPVLGLTRFEWDEYHRLHEDYGDIPGNPWIITTLWHAQWKMALAKNKEELKETEEWIEWTRGHMNEAGILPEQLNPFNGEHLSVAPLTWSHSTFVQTLLNYNQKLEELS